MITIYSETEVKQGSEKWHELRNQYITGTDAIKLLRGYTPQEILQSKREQNSFKGNYFTKRGHILEDESKEIYSEVYEPISNAGFIINDKFSHIGYSPDGLVRTYGLIECKSFAEQHHLKAIQAPDSSILAQIQWGLFITERDWCDLLLYNPNLPDLDKAYVVKHFTPIPEIQEKFQKILESSDFFIYNKNTT